MIRMYLIIHVKLISFEESNILRLPNPQPCTTYTPIQQIEERLTMGITVFDIITRVSSHRQHLPYSQIASHPVPMIHNNSTPSSHPPTIARLTPALIGGNFAVPRGRPLENEYGTPLHCPTPPPLVIVTTVV